jgi:hypothetical protein
MADYAKKLRDMQETVEQSDSGMRRSDETKARLRNLSERIRQSESAGAGRGGQGGPTAKELKKYEDKQDADVYTAEKGKPPTDPEMAKKRGGMVKKMASGGMTASKRADGIATRGKTKCKMY